MEVLTAAVFYDMKGAAYMAKYIIKRILYMIPVLLGVAFLVFTILSLTPGDPGSIILGMTAKP